MAAFSELYLSLSKCLKETVSRFHRRKLLVCKLGASLLARLSDSSSNRAPAPLA